MERSKVYELNDKVINNNVEILNIINTFPDKEMQNLFYLILEKNLFIRENIKLVRYLGKQKTTDCLKKMYQAILDENIRKNDEVLNTISVQKDWGMQQQLILAAQKDYILNDMNLFHLIANQRDWDNMQILRILFEKEYIRNDKEIVNTLVSLSDYRAKEVLGKALEHEIIRNNKDYINLIVSQGYYLCMLEMMDAILNPDIRADKNLLMIIDSYKEESLLQEQARLNLSIRQIRENLDNFSRIMKCEISIQEIIRNAYTNNIEVNLDDIIDSDLKRC